MFLFSIEDINHAFAYYESLINFSSPNPFSRLHLFLTGEWYFTFFLGILLSMPIVEFFIAKIKNDKRRVIVENSALLLLFILSISELANASYNPFLYFRF
jgi:hypothetical protein